VSGYAGSGEDGKLVDLKKFNANQLNISLINGGKP